jgi:hypothetical protein
MDRTKAAGWECNPEVPIAGDYLHCAPPGKPSVAELASDRPCRQDAKNLPNEEWGLLVLPGMDYRACHRFERTST